MFREFVYSEPNVLICLLTGLSVDVSGGLLLPRSTKSPASDVDVDVDVDHPVG